MQAALLPLVPAWRTIISVLAALLAAALLATNAQARQSHHEHDGNVALDWQAWHAVQTSSAETALSVVLSGGGVFTTGRTREMNSSSGRWLTVAYDLSTGAERWRALHPAVSAHGQEALDLVASPDGQRIFVAGELAQSPSVWSDLRVVAYATADGAEIWTADYGGTGGQSPRAIAVDPLGASVFAAGSEGSDLLVVAFAAADGATLWTRVYDASAEDDAAYDAVASPVGGAVFATGRSVVSNIGVGVTLALDAATGVPLWTAQEASANYLGELRAIAVAPNGGAVYAAGELAGADDVYAYDAATGATLWSAPFEDGAVDVAVSAGGARVYVAGTVTATGGDGDLRTSCFDAATGALLWSMDWDGPLPGADEEEAVALAPCISASSVLVCGTTAPTGGDRDWAAVAYDLTTGAELWANVEDGPAGLDDIPAAAAAGGEKVLAAGSAHGGTSESDLAVRVWNAYTGAAVWDDAIDQEVPANERLERLAVAPGGAGLYAAGARCCSQRAELLALDPDSGAELWNAVLGGTAPSRAEDVAVDPLGARVYSVGQRGDGAYVAARGGAELWLEPVAGAPWSMGAVQRVAAAPGGERVFLTGPAGTDSVASFDYRTEARDAQTGGLLWSAVHDPHQDFDRPAALAVAPDGSAVFVTGASAPTVYVDYWGYYWPDIDFGTVAYDAATGLPLWIAYYHGDPGHPAEEARAIAVAPGGRTVYVTGRAEGGADIDALTVAYDAATGAELWTARLDVPGGHHDLPVDLALDPAGARLFVIGASGSFSGQDHDWFAVAYDAATGAELWREVRSTATDDEPQGVALTPDGARAVVTGWTRDTAAGQPGADALTLVYDAATGVLLGEARFAAPTAQYLDDRLRAIVADPLGRRAFVVGECVEPGAAGRDALALAYRIPYLAGDVDAISLSKGGRQALSLVADAEHAGLVYLVLGTLGATTPGIPVDGVVLPLTFDTYLLFSLEHANQPPLGNTLGLLDGSALGAASFDVPLGSSLSHAGLELHHAYLVFAWPGPGYAVLASNAVSLALTF